MKVLRVFYVHHVMTDRKKADGSPAFEVLQCSRDFSCQTTPDVATGILERELGTHDNWKPTKGCVRVSAHRIVEQQVVSDRPVEDVRHTDLDLFPALAVKGFSKPRKNS